MTQQSTTTNVRMGAWLALIFAAGVLLAVAGGILVLGMLVWFGVIPGPGRQVATATVVVQPTEVAAIATATIEPTAEATVAPMETSVVEATAPEEEQMGDNTLPGELFQSPVECAKSFNPESSWLICEPGVLLDASTAWTIPGTDEKYSFNVPEGGFWYGSMGMGTITIDGITIGLSPEKGLNYLVLVRGRIDDGVVDSDLNLTGELVGHKPGHAIYSHMPTGAYVSRDWFYQQLVASTTGGFTNCGATGCSRVRVVLLDVDSHFKQVFEVRANDLDNWTLKN